jgi:hypothetical protein
MPIITPTAQVIAIALLQLETAAQRKSKAILQIFMLPMLRRSKVIFKKVGKVATMATADRTTPLQVTTADRTTHLQRATTGRTTPLQMVTRRCQALFLKLRVT